MKRAPRTARSSFCVGAHPEGLPHLMNNGPKGYKLVMRRENPDPEDEESVLDEEDKNGGSVEGTESGGGESPSVEAVGPSSGSGEASAPAE